MARPIVLSNGELHVGLNDFGLVHDFYFPYVGLENHSAGANMRHKIGVWVDGKISWLDDGKWNIRSWTAEGALIGHTRAHNPEIGVVLEFDDVVDTEISVLLRNIHVINDRSNQRDIRLFMRQAFAIGDTRSNTDTAQYLPDSDAVLHYRGRRAFVIGGRTANGDPFDQHTVGLSGIEGREGTYRDADDGELEGGNVEHGRVDSTIRFRLELAAHESARVHYWIAAGTSTREALYVHKNVRENGLDHYLNTSALWWHEWIEPVRKVSEKLPEHRRRLFMHSALVVKAHTDKRGAVIASTDTSMLNYSRDAYAYCWPRDGAYALWPLIRLGYVSEPRRFFEFCRRGLHASGYLMHKYQADGALGSSWHPYVHGNTTAPPIQEDETALVLFMFTQFYHIQKDRKLLVEFYDSFIAKMADFLCSYTDETTGLPRPSYDLWEENFITSTYTTSVVYAALEAAAELAEEAEDPDSAVRWRSAADDIKLAAHKHLFDQGRGLLIKGLRPNDDGYDRDTTLDLSSFYGAFMFGLFEPDGDEVRRTLDAIRNIFMEGKTVAGLPRYENDYYYRMNPSLPGNWWFITTLWLGQYGTELGDRRLTEEVLEWVESHGASSGMLSEQIDPDTARAVSVSPLVWSHAEYMATLLDTMAVKDGHHV